MNMVKAKGELKALGKRMVKHWHCYLFLLPAIAFFIVFSYIPMYGITLAFKDYRILDGIMGSPWTGFKYFEQLFSSVIFYDVLKNTLVLSFLNLIFLMPAPVIFALMINEVPNGIFKKSVQTISYLPHFISWIILSGIILELLSPSRGAINYIINLFGGEAVHFITEERYFRSILIISGIWQSVGWSSIVYLAAMAGISSEQLEASVIDGASRMQKIRYIVLPEIASVFSVMLILQVGKVLNSNFEQIFNLYNPQVYGVADVIDTYVYRMGLVKQEYSYTTAVSLFKNVIGFILIIITNQISKKLTDNEGGIW